jgi:hypothetical protein
MGHDTEVEVPLSQILVRTTSYLQPNQGPPYCLWYHATDTSTHWRVHCMLQLINVVLCECV